MLRREVLATIGAILTPATAAERIITDLYTAGDAGYHSYRIPSLLLTRKRTLIALCEGRKHGAGDSGDIDLVIRRSLDGGRTWSSQKTLFDFGDDVIGNPCPVLDRSTGVIWLFLTSNPGNVVEKQIIHGAAGARRTVRLSASKEGGLTWRDPIDVTPQVKHEGWGWYATGPGIGIQLRSGRLLIPCDHSRIEGRTYGSHVIYSDDHGTTWNIGGVVNGGANECQVAELPDGSLLLNMRMQSGEKKRGVARSFDGGVSWGPLSLDESLVDPVCQGSLISDEHQLLFSNPASTARRENLTVRWSDDMGKTWPRKFIIEPGPAGYSSLAALGQGRYACLYETGTKGAYEHIRFTSFTARDLKNT
jgi:sialidase-1